jgi:hypothetical protein
VKRDHDLPKPTIEPRFASFQIFQIGNFNIPNFPNWEFHISHRADLFLQVGIKACQFGLKNQLIGH